MVNIIEDDYDLLENFEYISRWIDAQVTTLPSSILAQIRALKPEKAFQINKILSPICGDKLYRYLFPTLKSEVSFEEFSDIQSLSNMDHMQGVHEWFLSLKIPSETMMVFLWEAYVAVETTWQVFVDYWDDFCYFGQDDVYIGAVSGQWYLFFFHEGSVVYGCVKKNIDI
jgi:hypothetical protein